MSLTKAHNRMIEGSKFNVKDFGAIGDGVTDDTAAIQLAINAAANSALIFPSGETFKVSSGLTNSSELTIIAEGSNIVGAGTDGDQDIFTHSSSDDLEIIGGSFSSTRRCFAFTAAGNVTVRNASFSDMGHAIAVNSTGSSVTSTGTLIVTDCKFDNLEIGVNVQSSRFDETFVSDCTFKAIEEQTISTRPYPFDKKIVSGVWYQSTSGECSVNVYNCLVDGVTEPTVAGAEPETHGIGITVDDDSDTDVLLSGNTIKNVSGTSTEGIEGLMGRGRRVIIIGNNVVDAGEREGMIYAKGSKYHKISNNIIEATGTPSSDVRGIISTGTNCDITNNKFIGTPTGIYTRALESKIADNEFISCGLYCIAQALEPSATHVKTFLSQNYADEDCVSFFADVTTASPVTFGDYIVDSNYLYNQGSSVNLSGGVNVKITNNHVDRVNPSSTRDVIFIDGATSWLVIQNNTFVSFDDSGSTGRVLTGNTTYTPKVFITENYFGDGNYGLWMRDQTYAEYIIRDNRFYSTNAVNGTIGGNVTVTGIGSQANNVGIDIT